MWIFRSNPYSESLACTQYFWLFFWPFPPSCDNTAKLQNNWIVKPDKLKAYSVQKLSLYSCFCLPHVHLYWNTKFGVKSTKHRLFSWTFNRTTSTALYVFKWYAATRKGRVIWHCWQRWYGTAGNCACGQKNICSKAFCNNNFQWVACSAFTNRNTYAAITAP